ncbi:MAG: ABC transporter permease [Methanosarcinaceae archaeon]|nr:ABC transporter permease [Methanosarcinaceae archaeon]MDD4331466.1 ABC transporter permease [Methanosarcinaceae archaeon]
MRAGDKKSYVLKRLFSGLLAFFLSLTLSFLLLRSLPGDYMTDLLLEVGRYAPPELVAAFKHEVGLDLPLPEQFLLYLIGILKGNWGHSFEYGLPVFTLIREKLYWTLILLLPSTFISLILGIGLGACSGWKNGSKTDALLLHFLVFVRAVPSYCWGFAGIFIFSFQLSLLPPGGYASLPGTENPSLFRHALLPGLTLAFGALPGTYYLMRNSMLKTLGEDYILAARARGFSELRILFGHALPNSLLPVLTQASLHCAHILAGSVFIETVFSWPGLGLLTFNALEAHDLPLLQGIFLIDTLLVITANLTADLLYPLIDPRIREGLN